jgi:uracil-DNA glycosylase family 4
MIRVPSRYPPGAKIMWIGEAPGAEEEKDGEFFVGTAGKLLRKCLMMSGINPDEVYFANLAKYRPPNNKIRAWFDNSGMPNDIVLMGLLELKAEIEQFRAGGGNVIVASGNYPLWALTKKARWIKTDTDEGKQFVYSGIFDWRGSMIECTIPGLEDMKVIPTFHPSFINREGYKHHGTFLADIERIKRESAFRELRLPQKELILNPEGSQRLECLDRVMADSHGIITFDIEFVNNKNLICVGMTNARDWAFSVETRGSNDVDFVRKVLLSGIGLNAQNSAFDCSVLEWHYNMPVIKHLVFDTMLASHAANIELPKGLDYLVSIYTDQRYYKDMVDWKLIKEGKQPVDQILLYNCIDTWTQHEIMEEQWKYDLNDPTVRRTFEFEMQLLPVLWEMTKRGIRVDTERLVHLDTTLKYEAAGLTELLSRQVNRNINVKSTADVQWLLFEHLGLKSIRKTATGQDGVDDKTIAALLIKAETDYQRTIIRLLRDIRNRRDLRSKFSDVEFDTDGRARGHYNPAGTDTGRLASKKFFPTGLGLQQQNIPRDKRARSVFIPDPDRVFGYADLERAESLVVAWLTLDPEMLRVHGPGVDAHRELASYLFDKPVEDVTEDERYVGKQTRHAGNYMQGARTMALNVNKVAEKTGVSVTEGECKTYLTKYKDIHPFLKPWWNETEAQLWATRTLFNLLGRKRQFYGHIGSIVPAAVAYVPQSTVGDTLNVGLLNLAGVKTSYMEELGLWTQYEEWAGQLKETGYEPLLQVHDAVGFQMYHDAVYSVPEKNADHALDLIRKLMTLPLTVPKTLETFAIPVEIMIGPSWGEVKVWPEKKAA